MQKPNRTLLRHIAIFGVAKLTYCDLGSVSCGCLDYTLQTIIGRPGLQARHPLSYDKGQSDLRNVSCPCFDSFRSDAI